MPYSTKLDKTRAEIAEPLSRREIRGLAKNDEIRVVQASSTIKRSTWRKLDAEFFRHRPDVQLRVYGFYSDRCDLGFCEDLTSVEIFAADCLQKASHVEAIAAISRLRALSIGIYDLETFDVLDRVSPRVTTLQLGATRSRKPDLAALSRFQDLEVLYLEGQQKNIEVLSGLRNLEDITLRSVTTPSLDYIATLSRLWSVDIKLGGIRDLSALSVLPSLKYLELWQVRGLSQLDVVSDLRSLQNLFLQSLPRVLALPSLKRSMSLRRILLQNMKGLRDFSALQHAPALEEFLLVQGEKSAPEDLVPVLSNPRVRQASAYFGSDRRNRAFEALASEHGKTRFERCAFEYR
jgi:hypothetical protein